VSSVLHELTESAGDLPFGESRSVEMKGISGIRTVYEVQWAGASTRDAARPAADSKYVFRCEGEYWTLSFEAPSVAPRARGPARQQLGHERQSRSRPVACGWPRGRGATDGALERERPVLTLAAEDVLGVRGGPGGVPGGRARPLHLVYGTDPGDALHLDGADSPKGDRRRSPSARAAPRTPRISPPRALSVMRAARITFCRRSRRIPGSPRRCGARSAPESAPRDGAL